MISARGLTRQRYLNSNPRAYLVAADEMSKKSVGDVSDLAGCRAARTLGLVPLKGVVR